jgi:16S rRNA (cytosine967-C5)-methyltransferase
MPSRIGVLTRATAIDALCHILGRKLHADVALDNLFKAHPELRPIDRAFIYEIVLGSLRWLSKMDWILGHMLDRPFHALDPRVANALRVGTYQIFYMDRVPDRAAVAETVEAVKSMGAGQAASFVNAILRRVARKAEYFPKPDKETAAVDYYSMHTAHPSWMVSKWLDLMPLERLEHVLSSHNREPNKTLRILRKRPLAGGESLATYLLRTQGIHSETRPLKSALRVTDYPRFHECEAFAAGCYIVQDESAQLAASIVQPGPGESVYDCCAAPGGKTIAIWDDADESVSYFVSDSSKKRLATLEQNFARLGLLEQPQVHLQVAEAGVGFEGQTFDKVVLDAPCSSMGVIARNPEIKWHRVPADIATAAVQQEKMLDTMAKRVKVGGELIYMVCSFEPEETTTQIARFTERHPEFIAVDLRGRIHDYYRKYLSHDGSLVIYSGNQDGIDGFFACALSRRR